MVLLLSIFDNTSSPTAVQMTCWSAAIPIEVVISSAVHRERALGDPLGGPIRDSLNLWKILEAISNSVRILALVTLVLLYANKSSLLTNDGETSGDRSKTTRPLDPSQTGNVTNIEMYNPINGGPLPTASKSQDPGVHWTTIPTRSWWEYVRAYSFFLPYIWPSNSYRLKLATLACLFLLAVQRINNVMVPDQVGIITTALANQQEANAFYVPWSQIILFVFYKWLQISLSSLRSALWITVNQYSRMEVSTAAFEHVHNLGLDFHCRFGLWPFALLNNLKVIIQ